jgi:hypothetical protein
VGIGANLHFLENAARNRGGPYAVFPEFHQYVPPGPILYVCAYATDRRAAMQSQMSPIVRALAFVGLAVLLTSGHASAQTEAHDIRARVKEGQKVSITDDRGYEFNGRITTIAADALTVTPDEPPRVVVPYAQIVSIDRPHDTLNNGALIGLAFGAALGFGAMAAEAHRSCTPDSGPFGDDDCSDPTGAGYIGGALLIGGLGSAVGVGVDALIRRDRGIYRRGGNAQVGLSPVLARGRRGAVLSMSW